MKIKLTDIPVWAHNSIIPFIIFLDMNKISYTITSDLDGDAKIYNINLKSYIVTFYEAEDFIILNHKIDNNDNNVTELYHYERDDDFINQINDEKIGMYTSKTLIETLEKSYKKVLNFNYNEIMKKYELWKIDNRGSISAKNLGLV